jgi:hypothetical protein
MVPSRRYPYTGGAERGILLARGFFTGEATLATSQHRKASLRHELSDIFEHVDSTNKSGLIFLAPLTYLLIIKEYCPHVSPCGPFRLPHIADPDPVAGHVARAHRHVRPAPNESCPMDLVFAPSQIESWPLDRLRPYARNAKIHGTDQVAKIAASMAKFGWTVHCMVADSVVAGPPVRLISRAIDIS